MQIERKAPYKYYSQSGEGFGIAREVPRCVAACPACCDVHGYLRLVREGRYSEAYSLIMETIPFPASIGRICHHPCELSCRRGYFDVPVSIAAVKRFAGDYVHHASRRTENLHEPVCNSKRVAIIGAGPAGLTAAFRLARKGYEVKVYEKLPTEGGMLSVGIPPYRLPKDVLKAEIEEIKRSGIEIETGKVIDKSEFERLRRDYDAIFIATGMHESRHLGIEGENLKGVIHGVEFLREFNLRGCVAQTGKRVAVIGGGNVAMDVARSLIRMGADVTVVYRRTRAEMPASADEVKEAEEEGVRFMFLATPVRFIGRERVEKLELIRMKLGAPDASGRRQPIPIKGLRFTLDVDMVIPAIGQTSRFQFLEGSGVELENGRIKVDEHCATTAEGIFAGGDCARGAAFAVDAIADGNIAAESIDMFLRGTENRQHVRYKPQELPDEAEYIQEELSTEQELELLAHASRHELPKIDIDERRNSFKEVSQGLTEDEAIAESDRCLSCRGCLVTVSDLKVEIENADEYVAKLMYRTGVNKCAECGECTASCPVAAIDIMFSPRKLAGIAMMDDADKLASSNDIWSCITCGICNAICPYGVDFLGFIQGLRTLAVSRGNVPHYIRQKQTEEIRSTTDRLSWLEGADDLEVAEHGEVYYFCGCLAYLDRVYSDRTNLRLLDIARSAVRLLNHVGIVPAVSSAERCCGHDLLWLGDETDFKKLMYANIELIKASGAKTVVFTCAECLRTFEVDYRRFYGDELGFELMHISEFLRDKAMDLKESELVTTYHDPCRLRHLRQYDAPRAMLARIPGLKQVEMTHNREQGLCCGVSSLLNCSPAARAMQRVRLKEAEQTGASKLVVTCPKCWIHLDCAIENDVEMKGSKLEIEDLTALIAAHIKK